MFSQANIALFEARCKEKIQQFEDAGSDEEDIWDEKDVTFAPESQRRPRSANKHAHVLNSVAAPFSSLVSIERKQVVSRSLHVCCVLEKGGVCVGGGGGGVLATR